MAKGNDQPELGAVMEELDRLRAENASLRHELAETNRGVTALYLELDRRAEELEQKDRQKDEFLAMLGHELRNPLAAARAAVDYLQHVGSAGGVELDRTRAILDRQLHNLRRIVDDLLEVSRIARGQVKIHEEPANLTVCIHNTVQAHETQLEAAGHELRLSLPDEPLWGWFDPTRTEQVIANLLDNAIKYTPPPGRIDIRARRVEVASGPWAHIEVQDTGEGIEPDRLPDVFKTFVQEQRTLDRSRGGLGLGLSLVKRLVELHGGEIEAQSEGRGCGSTFSLWLPLNDRAADVRPEQQVPPPGAREQRRVLLVEDNDDLRETIADLLALEGYDVEAASSGTEGLARYCEQARDVVLLDIGLPGIDGFELARQIRAQPTGHLARLIALTGYGDEQVTVAVREAGFDSHLVKPVDLDDLFAEVAKERDEGSVRAAPERQRC